ncbi:hypothetical protein M758_11G156800 [Ceratodon purpureus]|nr:hypothetical protein M758_11G156800 [Ceratodon purpureus]KAG0602057.1 hypothetical protein M758_11G156800 [Ceratodon purpureus]
MSELDMILVFSIFWKRNVMNRARDVIISSNTFSSKSGNQSFSGSRPIGLRLHPQVVHMKKSKTSFRRLLSHSFLSSGSGEAAMRGWNVSIAKAKGTHDWRQFWSSGRRTHMGHSHGHDHDHGPHEKLGAYGEKILRWGLWSDIFLTIGKVAAGYVSGSTAIIADAAHSASDIVLSGVALWSSKASKAPPDQEHPYGHGKIETMGAMGISTLLLVTGGGIAWTAIDVLQVLIPDMFNAEGAIVKATVDTVVHQEVHSHGHNHEHGFVGHKHVFDTEHMEVALFAAIVGIGAKEGLYWITKAAGEKSGSALLKATAWHHRGDSVSTIVALVGVGGAMMGMPLLDPVAALLVSGMIVKAGLENGYQSMQELLDKGLPQSILAPIRKTVLQVDGVEGIHQLRGRRMGSTVHVDVHIEVDPWLSVSAAHNIGEAVRQQVRTHHPNVTESFIHIDPADGRPSLSVPGGMVLENLAEDKHPDEHTHDHAHKHRHHGDHGTQHQHSHSHGHDHKHHHNKHSHGHEHEHDRDHGKNTSGEVKGKNERLRDLTRVGPKSELLGSGGTMSKDGRGVFHDTIDTLRQAEVERIVRYVLQANFSKN